MVESMEKFGCQTKLRFSKDFEEKLIAFNVLFNVEAFNKEHS